MSRITWRLVYFLSIGFRFVLALSNSYIHPDEHFQTLEVLTNRILGYSASIPWEFSEANPARSLAPLYILYAPVLYLLKLANWGFSPLQIWYILRLQNVVIGWLITDKVIYAILPTKPERIKGVFFTSTSYITLVYQSHLFSNSVETWLVLLCVMIIDNLRYISESTVPSVRSEKQYQPLFWLGLLVSFGIFNRVTFPAFLILPFLFVLQFLRIHKLGVLFLALGFVIPTIAFIAFDTVMFGGWENIVSNPFELTSYTIAPLNNIIYNSSYNNLATHGIHPFYNHVLVNLPQILGPTGILFLGWKFKNKYWRTIPFLTVVSGVVVLSLVPHQELRFLIPILPLLCCCFDITAFSPPPKDTKEPKDKDAKVENSSLVSLLLYVWYIFNILMSILMGVYHQGGVVPALDHFHSSIIPEATNNTVQIWWRTYSPPSWVIGDASNTTQSIALTDGNSNFKLDHSKSNYIIDAMGSDLEMITQLLEDKSLAGKTIYLVTPVASFNVNFQNNNNFNKTWSYSTHLDLDHLDFSNTQSLVPGLGIYELL